MDLTALLTSAGINTGVCLGLFSLYSVLRKQPSFASVYFGQKLSHANTNQQDPFWFERLLPSASWILKAWEASEDDIYAAGGVDAVVFLRAVVFSIRIFSVAATVCLFLVLPVNYYGKNMVHTGISGEKLDVFGIRNIAEGSKWLSIHCLALYIITCCSCCLLYIEYKNIMEMRLAHIGESLSSPSHFTIIVRAIPWINGSSCSDAVYKYFTELYSSSYLSHQMVYESGAVQKLMRDAEKMYTMLKSNHLEKHCAPQFLKCCYCGGATTSFKILSNDSEGSTKKGINRESAEMRKKECEAALVFFRTRYAALLASEALQSPDPMSWVTDAAPEPEDIFWSNLCVAYRLLWIRKIIVKVAAVCLVLFFLPPVVFTQSLVHFEKIKNTFPPYAFIAERAKKDYSSVILFSVSMKIFEELISGYLPSVVFIIFLYIVAPVMMVLSTLEGPKSRSGRKRSTCVKVVVFIIWNVFFANILSEAAINHYSVSIGKLGDPKKIPNVLARAVPATATFFMTYVLTSGWACLGLELIQLFPLLSIMFSKYILHSDEHTSYAYTFPYHTEVPRVLLFGLLGFTYSIVAPIILPILMVYFLLAYLVYRNQIMNVYITKYDTGGLYWPIVHNTTIFSLVLTQTIALGFFGIKKSPVVSTFTIPLIICTLLFNEYCRQRFLPVFQKTPAQTIIEMDRKDETCGRTEEMHQMLQSAYCQFKTKSLNLHETAKQNQTQFMEVELQ